MLSSLGFKRFFRVKAFVTRPEGFKVDIYRKVPFDSHASIEHHSTTFLFLKTLHVPAGETIADVAVENGLDVKISCTRGACLSCCGKVIEGEVEMAQQVTLSTDHVQQGYTLLCCSTPRSNCVVITETSEEI